MSVRDSYSQGRFTVGKMISKKKKIFINQRPGIPSMKKPVLYLIIRRTKTNRNSGVVSVQPAEVVTSQQDTCTLGRE
nr:hypothetical protein [Tanacetum cinerariifolium]